MKKKLLIGGVPFQVVIKEDLRDADGEKVWGHISDEKCTMWLEAKAGPEKQLRVTLHEVLHIIVHEYHVKIPKKHLENSLDQLALGMAEVLESLGITKLPL